MSTMFLSSLFVLLVAIHVTLACKCKPITLLQAMCSSTTVVQARVSDGQPFQVGAVPYRIYEMDVSRIFRTETNKRLTLDHNKGSLIFPEKVSNCGGILTDGMDYVIAGYINKNGTLFSSHCYHYVPYEHLTRNPHAMNILIGEGDCNDA